MTDSCGAHEIRTAAGENRTEDERGGAAMS